MAMTTARKRALALTGAFLGLVAVAVTVVPSSAEPAPSSVRLHLDDDGRYFAYGDTRQNLAPAKNGCQITSPESFIDLSSDPGGSSPGIVDDSLGVKRSNSSSNGTPCGQVDGTESLTIARKTAGNGAILAGRRFTDVRLDLELTGDAVVKLTFGGGSSDPTYVLQTGNNIDDDEADELDTVVPYTASSGPDDLVDGCATPNSSGPNSGPSDNCLWSVDPGFEFDSITITTTAGTAALEGGADFDGFGGPAGFETLLNLDNDPPAATDDDDFTTPEDTPLTTANVLSNDTDPDGGTLLASLVSGPAEGTGTVNLNPNGSFTYTPPADYNGTAEFTYAASDGADSDEATVTITVTPVNDPPVAVNDPAATDEDTLVTITVATDIDSDNLIADCTVTDEHGDPVVDATITDNGDGTVDVTPPADFFGDLTMTCDIEDEEGEPATSQSIISVGVDGVNDAPVAVDDAADVDMGSSVLIDVVANDLDVEDDALTPSLPLVDDAEPAGATVTLEAGQVRYTPPAGFIGEGSFTYQAHDGALPSANTATVTVTVFPVICSQQTVSDQDPDVDPEVTGSFTRLTDSEDCKRYEVVADADDGSGTVRFVPEGAATVAYRGVLTFPADSPPVGPYPLLLQYDPTGGSTYKPVQWCKDPQFTGGLVTSATLPGDQPEPGEPGYEDRETWCVAKAETVPNGAGDLETTWQVYGEDDPRFTR